MTARIDCKECDSEHDEGRELIYFCPLHREASAMLAALRLALPFMPALHSYSDEVRRVIARASRTWQEMLDDDRKADLARMRHD